MTDQEIIKAADQAELCFPICWALDMDQKDWGEQEYRQMDKLRRFVELIKTS